MRNELILLATLATLPAAAAQVVHPNQYELTDGTSSNSYPFRFSTGAGRYQQSYEAAQFPGPMTITEIAFRYRNDTSYSSGTCDFKLTLSYCATAWNTLSATFASNVGGNATVVHDGVWTFPAFGGHPAQPNPFTQRLILATPFVYNPSSGDLLMDVEMRSSATSSSGGSFASTATAVGVSRVYSNTGTPTATSGGSDGIGLITEFTQGSISTYGDGCSGTGGFTPLLSMAGVPAVGEQVTLTLSQGLGNAQSLTMVSAGEASTPIGAECVLLVQFPGLGLVIPLGGTGAGTGSYTLQGIIPTDAPAASIYFQAFVADPGSPIGFSTSNGVRAQIQ